jgi:hypothetical protein
LKKLERIGLESKIGKNTKIIIEKNIATTPANLSGIARKIA